jgi:hypothetical protein
MDPETKEFLPETKETPDDHPRFHVGDDWEMNGVLMRIRKITKKDIVLRPVKG